MILKEELLLLFLLNLVFLVLLINMIIKNTSAKVHADKVIGVGKFWLLPGEEKDIPDFEILTPILDDRGRSTGKMDVIPSLKVQKKMGLIDFDYHQKTAAKDAHAQDDTAADKADDTTEEEGRELTPAEKRARTRAANAAAKAAEASAE